MIIVLIGYMGSGKSTIGSQLADALEYNFIDLDDYISSSEGSSISDIFTTKGEIYFRKQEHHYLNEILSSKDNTVLSLGGGTPCYYDNMSAIAANANVISLYLKLAIPNLSQRLFNEREKRPLISHIQSQEDLTEFIGKHLFERVQFYSQAKYVINADQKSIKNILEEIIILLI
ncbi:MAG: shikimate kinase [Winogradskyella sp.]|uniref:shikimate kinase n=1 Tax=Winogradskyella sp. TaxID=1883156 RepID=UPI0025F0181B|nr:shikimate kinase [Winogradskyella sp.]NRB58730.1 shikimate kinase [Winogradskyella sp.]